MLALRLVVLALGALLAGIGARRVRALERQHRHRWGSDADRRELPAGGAYRAARVTILVERGVPRIVRLAAILGMIVAACNVVVLAMVPLTLAERLGSHADQVWLAVPLLVALAAAVLVLARSVAADAERLARCEPEELEEATAIDALLVHCGAHGVVILVALAAVSDHLLAAVSAGTLALVVAQLALMRRAAAHARDALREASIVGA